MKKLFEKIKQINWENLAYGIGIIFMFIFLSKEIRKENKAEIITEEVNTDFKDDVLNYIYEMRIDHPYIVYAQAIKETGTFTSAIFLENHNLFGMKAAYGRATTCIGINRGHAVYLNWKMSIIDYALFQESYMRNLSEDEYFAKLGKIYAQDKNYERDLRILVKSIK
jgi:uncharacterized FlgJ-related protein